MKRKVLRSLCILGSVLTAVACTQAQPASPEQQLLERMSLEEKIGQMMMVGFRGETPTEDARKLVQDMKAGSVILFSNAGNIKHPLQTARLTNGLQRMAEQTRLKIPLIVSVDQEGGSVARLTEGFTETAGNMSLGAVADEKRTERDAGMIAEELAAVGINMNLAPVLDVNVNPDNPVIGTRSFGEDPQLVARLGEAFVRAHQKRGVVPTVKHFPGHGDTHVDSHLGLPVIPKSREEFERVELVPFKRAIEAGVDVIMTAHIHVPSLDPTPDLPATLSKPILTGLLREKLGFEGVIVTDSMTMAGVSGTFGGVPQAAVKAVEAGADIILLPPFSSTKEPFEVRDAILEAVRSGEISEERIDRSVLRILRLKQKYALDKRRYVEETGVAERTGTDKNRQQALDTARRAVTLLKNDGNLLPLHLSSGQKVGIITPYSLIGKVKAHHFRVEELTVERRDLTDAERNDILRWAKDKDLLIVGTHNADRQPRMARLVRELQNAGKPVAVVAFGNPYDIRAFPGVDAYLAVYGFRQVHLQAAVDTLFGRNNPSGRLPVTVPDLYPAGSGLGYTGTK
ncbi:beta-N-acetylhexosaminidase [Staphylospora marina]|uniref:beta-N-acetylhexosaminidase n=1 Tax=Staphylospora marina TaxID=2490858 RepID=UPI000F5BF3E5|nr:beta-N-acetylhexosaminidase [Staphylospora marina]